jgi:hypothetical protein
MADIFVSYSHTDRQITEWLVGHLRSRNFNVIYDESLTAGDGFKQYISDWIRDAHATLVIWSPNSIGSEWVPYEAAAADTHRNYIPLTHNSPDIRRIPEPLRPKTMRPANDIEGVVKALDGRVWPLPRKAEALEANIQAEGAPFNITTKKRNAINIVYRALSYPGISNVFAGPFDATFATTTPLTGSVNEDSIYLKYGPKYAPARASIGAACSRPGRRWP